MATGPKEQRNLYKEINLTVEAIDKKLKSVSKTEKGIKSILTETKKNWEAIRDTSAEMQKNAKNIGTTAFKTLDFTKKKKGLEQQIEEIEKRRAKSSNYLQETHYQQLLQAKQMVDLQEQENQLEEEKHKKVQETAAVAADHVSSMIASVPGGALLQKMLDPSGSKVKNLIAKQIKGKMEGFAPTDESGKALKGEEKIAAEKAKANEIAGEMAGKMALAAAAVAAMAALWSTIINAGLQFANDARNFQASLGVSGAVAKEMVKDTRELAHETRNIGVLNEDVKNAVQAVSEVYERIPNAQGEQVKNTLKMNRLFGVGMSDAAGMLRMFEEMGATSDEAFQTGVLASNLAEAAGVPLGAVIQDIAANAGVAATYFKGSKEELIASAVAAKQLGMSMGDIGKMAGKLMDIESSLQSEMQAQVILGREINFDKERALIYDGKMDEALESVVGKMGDISSWNKKTFLEKEALAEASGFEVGQIQKALEKKKLMLQMTGEERRRLEEAEQALSSQNELSAEGLVLQAERALKEQEMAAQWEDVKLQMQEAFLPLAESVLPALAIIGQGLAGMFKILNMMGPVVWILVGAATAYAAAMAVSAIATIVTSFGVAGMMAAGILGAGALAGLVGWAAGDALVSADGPTIISKEGQMIHGSANDDAALGVNVVPRLTGPTQTGGGTSVDMNSTNQRLDKLINAVEAKQVVQMEGVAITDIVNKTNGVRNATAPQHNNESSNWL